MLAAPTLTGVTSAGVTVVLPSQPAGFSDYGAIVGYAITASSSAVSWCDGCVNSSSWNYSETPWGSMVATPASWSGEPGTTYYVRVAIKDVFDRWAWSDPTEFTTLSIGG